VPNDLKSNIKSIRKSHLKAILKRGIKTAAHNPKILILIITKLTKIKVTTANKQLPVNKEAPRVKITPSPAIIAKELKGQPPPKEITSALRLWHETQPSKLSLRYIHFNLVSPRKKVEEKPLNGGIMTPSVNRKDNNLLPPTSNKNLPPKPVNNGNNNVSYKLPPKPTPIMPTKQNYSVDISRPYSSR